MINNLLVTPFVAPNRKPAYWERENTLKNYDPFHSFTQLNSKPSSSIEL